MTRSQDDAVDDLLRKHFDGPVRDDGFSDRFMQQLPKRRHIAWPLWAGIAGGVSACGLNLAAAPLLHLGVQDLMSGRLSSSAIALLLAMASLSLLACGWSLTEADEH